MIKTIKSVEELNNFVRLGNNLLKWDYITLWSFIQKVPSTYSNYMFYEVVENLDKILIFSWEKGYIATSTKSNKISLKFNNPSDGIEFCEQHFRKLITESLLSGKTYKLEIIEDQQ